MPRPPHFSDSDLLAAAGRLIAAGGPSAATVGAIAGEAGAPSGSLYHRFASRDELLARLWLDCVECFQAGILEALKRGDGLAAALHTPRWCRLEPAAAQILLLHRRDELVAAELPPSVAARVLHVNDAGRAALKHWTKLNVDSRANALAQARYALVEAPVAAVRPHLQKGEPPPAFVDDLVAATYRVVISKEG
jgi:AcrR family transcriptional regulator